MAASDHGEEPSAEVIACLEFLAKEERYVEQELKICHEIFLVRLKAHLEVGQKILSQDQIDTLFRNFPTLYNAHRNLYTEDLLVLRMQSPEALCLGLGEKLKDFIPFLKLYIEYLGRKDSAMKMLKDLSQSGFISGSSFPNFLLVNECVASKICESKEISLKYLLQRPTNRLVEYATDLYDLCQTFSDPSEPHARNIFDALKEVQDILEKITESVRSNKARKQIGYVQDKLFGGKIHLLTPTRFVVKKGDVKLVHSNKLCKLKAVLCSDIILTQRPKGYSSYFGGGGTLGWVLAMKGLEVIENIQGNELENQDVIKEIQSFPPALRVGLRNTIAKTEIYVIVFHDQKSRDSWVKAIKERIQAEEMTTKPCNPIGLEKRLEGKKNLTPEEAEYYMEITDVDQISQIRQNQSRIYVSRQATGQHGEAVLIDALVNVTTKELGLPPAGSPRVSQPPPPRSNTPRGPPPRMGSGKKPLPPKPSPRGKPPRAPYKKGNAPPPRKPAATPKAGGRANLFAAIQAGAQLKKIEDAPPPKQAAPKKLTLLEQIQLGGKKNLKKAVQRKKSAVSQTDRNLLSGVQEALKRYREHVVQSDDESDDDSDWD